MAVNRCDYCHEPVTFSNTACLCYATCDKCGSELDGGEVEGLCSRCGIEHQIDEVHAEECRKER